MIVTIEQIYAGLIKYIDNDLGAKATGWTKFAVYFLAGSLQGKLPTLIANFRSNPMFSDLFDDNGNVKIDVVHERALDAIRHSGKLYINGLNYFADEKDIEALYSYIRNS